MFEGSGRLRPEVAFPALAAAISEIPLRAERGADSAVAEEARALMSLRREVDARLLDRIAAVDEQGLAAADGFPSTASWVRGFANLDRGQAAGIVGAARLAERMPALGGVLAQGKIGVEHLQAVASGAAHVPAEELAKSDTTLANLAPHVRPSDMRQAAKVIQARVDADSVDQDAAYLHESRRLTLAKTFGDAYHLEGLLEPEAGAALAAALEPLMARRGEEDTRNPAQRRADALIELTGAALRAASLPDCGGDRPRLTFLVRTGAPSLLPALGDLAGAVTGRGSGALFSGSQVGVSAFGDPDNMGLLIGTTGLLPFETIARIGCDADINVATVNELGEILNFDRTRRDPSPAQRRALVLRDQGCVFPGCDRPPALCQVHHLIWWIRGGKTNLDNLALICEYHHHLLHEGGWRIERVPPALGAPPGWLVTAKDGRQLREFRQPAA
ncbi:MAG: hypothetical protein QOJ11_258 [Frankiales bacterium]|jgi:hypothetical protein|nr:hypothetical protein [Frankiales bacterium]